MASVSSTTPRFGPRCPPVFERTEISSSRISSARISSWGTVSVLTSSGEWMVSSSWVMGLNGWGCNLDDRPKRKDAASGSVVRTVQVIHKASKSYKINELSPHLRAAKRTVLGILITHASAEKHQGDREGDEHHLHGD